MEKRKTKPKIFFVVFSKIFYYKFILIKTGEVYYFSIYIFLNDNQHIIPEIMLFYDIHLQKQNKYELLIVFKVTHHSVEKFFIGYYQFVADV